MCWFGCWLARPSGRPSANESVYNRTTEQDWKSRVVIEMKNGKIIYARKHQQHQTDNAKVTQLTSNIKAGAPEIKQQETESNASVECFAGH